MKIFLKPTFSTSFIKKPMQGKQRIPIDRKMTIGRHSSSDIQLYHAIVSKSHVTLEPTEEGLQAINISNENCMNGEIKNQVLLKNGDQLRVAQFPFLIEVMSDAEASNAAAETICPMS